MSEGFQQLVEAYLARKLALENFTITDFEQISGAGLSRSVYRIAAFDGQKEAIYILLQANPTSPVPPNFTAEYEALRSLSDVSDIIVPRAYCMEDTAEALGSPFLVTSLLPGVTSPRQLFKPRYNAQSKSIARQGYEILGRLAALDADAVNLGPSTQAEPPENVHLTALDSLEKILEDNHATRRPITAAALRHLRRTPPPAPAKISIVHGDYRIGNYLFDETGITGIIDWEMVHKGNPLEDLAWSMLPNWEFAAYPGLVAGHLSHEEAIDIWQQSSGLSVEAEALEWWVVFCHLKAIGIWASGHRQFLNGKTTDLMMGMIGYAIPRQEFYIAELLMGAGA